MSDELALNPTGSEANLKRAARFENRLVALGVELGWDVLVRNVDLFIRHNGQSQSRGVDVLWAVENPQTEDGEGMLGEAKVHGEQASLSVLQHELQTLYGKMTKAPTRSTLWEHPAVRQRISVLRWGLLAHRTNDYDAAAARANLRDVELQERRRGARPPVIYHVGPDTLEAIADCFAAAGAPAAFFWPPTSMQEQAWGRSCPPGQLAAGMLAYRTGEDIVLWLRDTLTDHDADAVLEIARAWDLQFTTVVASMLDADRWAAVRDGWERTAQRSRGRLPDRVSVRDLAYSRMNRFDERYSDDDA